MADWARSGAMALTGRPGGPPLVAPGRPASVVREGLEKLGRDVPGLLGERAAYAGLRRRAPLSCGGTMRFVATRDGHVALSLARAADVELIPALVEAAVEDPWKALASWAARMSTLEVADRMELLGLPGGAVPSRPAPLRPVDVSTGDVAVSVMGSRTVTDTPTILDLTSLWAGPLCAHLLGLAGARVIRVDSVSRPDPSRDSNPGFVDLLREGHDSVSLDLRSPGDQARLRALMGSADLVLEASRPRALSRLGIDAEEVARDGTSWLSITARGRASDAVGFGDDVAATAGLVLDDGGALIPVGDAIADPLAGVSAAVAAMEALRSPQVRLIDVSMQHVARATIGPVPPHQLVRRSGGWWVECDVGAFPVAEPETRR